MALTTLLLLSFQAQDHSGAHLSGVLLAISVPMMLIAPVAGGLADRIGARSLIAVGSLVQVVAAGVQLSAPSPGVAVLLVAGYAAGMALVAAALQVELPTLVPLDHLGRATGLASAAQTTAFMLGPMIAALVYESAGPRNAMTAVAASSVLILLSTLAPRSPLQPGALPLAPPSRTARIARARWLGGLWIVDRVSLVVVMYTGALALMLHPTAVIEVMLVRESLGAGAAVLGLVGAGWSIGMVFGSLLAGRLSLTTANLSRWLMISGGIQAAALGAAGLSASPWALIALYVVGGFWCGGTNVARQTLIVMRAPDGTRGRALALVVAVHNGVQALGLGAGGLAVEILDPRVAYLLCGAMGLLVTAAFLPWMYRAVATHHAAAV